MLLRTHGVRQNERLLFRADVEFPPSIAPFSDPIKPDPHRTTCAGCMPNTGRPRFGKLSLYRGNWARPMFNECFGLIVAR
jgi:hypothetical protein